MMRKFTKKLKRVIILTAIFFAPFIIKAQTWTTITTDTSGDGSQSILLDGTKLEFKYDPGTDSLFFRITVASISSTQAGNFGVNILVNPPGTPFNFWGADNMAAWTKLATTWVSGSAPSNYSGTIGIGNSSGVSSGTNYTNLFQNNIRIVLDQMANTITLGMKRKEFITDVEMNGSSSITVKAAAAVGSSTSWNDDIYTSTGSMTLNNVPVPTNSLPEVAGNKTVRLYPNPVAASMMVEFPAGESANGDVTVTDIAGRQMQLENVITINNGDILIGVETLEAAVYWLNATTQAGNSYQQKFVVVK